MSVDINVKHSITDESQTVSKYGDNNNNKYNNNPLFRFVFLFFSTLFKEFTDSWWTWFCFFSYFSVSAGLKLAVQN